MKATCAGCARTDGELVLAARAGHRSAFDVLLERHQRRGVAAAYRVLGNVHDALEVCQDAMVRAYRRLHLLQAPEAFAPWFARIVINLALNRRRGRRARRAVEAELRDVTAGARVRSGMARCPARPSARMRAAELELRIRSGLERLPERQRAALLLFSVERMPQKQVAQILGCSIEAVKWHIHQARRRLRVHLADDVENAFDD